MEKQPRCKKCGRRLKSPMSIAMGMGPKCAGISGLHGRSVRAGIRHRSGTVYSDSDSNPIQTSLFPTEMTAKRLSKKELFRRRREERRRLFETHKPFQCGMLMPKRRQLVYIPLDDGNWKEDPTGRIISHERLQEYLQRYRLV